MPRPCSDRADIIQLPHACRWLPLVSPTILLSVVCSNRRWRRRRRRTSRRAAEAAFLQLLKDHTPSAVARDSSSSPRGVAQLLHDGGHAARGGSEGRRAENRRR